MSIKTKILSYIDEAHYGLADKKDIFPLLVTGFLGVVIHNDFAREKYYKLCAKRIKDYYFERICSEVVNLHLSFAG